MVLRPLTWPIEVIVATMRSRRGADSVADLPDGRAWLFIELDDDDTAPTSATRSGSPGAAQSWDDLGRRGQIFTSCGPSAQQIEAVTGEPALEPIRVYATQGDVGVAGAGAAAMAAARRNGAPHRGTLVGNTPAGRGWAGGHQGRPGGGGRRRAG